MTTLLPVPVVVTSDTPGVPGVSVIEPVPATITSGLIDGVPPVIVIVPAPGLKSCGVIVGVPPVIVMCPVPGTSTMMWIDGVPPVMVIDPAPGASVMYDVAVDWIATMSRQPSCLDPLSLDNRFFRCSYYY